MLLFTSACGSVKIHDDPFCYPIPGDYGATCDRFFTHKQEILNKEQWLARQDEWIKDAGGVTCTPAQTVANKKGEIEKLCSRVTCSQELLDALAGLQKMEKIANISRSLSIQ